MAKEQVWTSEEATAGRMSNGRADGSPTEKEVWQLKDGTRMPSKHQRG